MQFLDGMERSSTSNRNWNALGFTSRLECCFSREIGFGFSNSCEKHGIKLGGRVHFSLFDFVRDAVN